MPVSLPSDFPLAPTLQPPTLAEALAWHDRIGKGISSTVVAQVAAGLGFSNAVIARAVYGEDALPRGRARPLTLEQANALYRFLQVAAGLEAAFGNRQKEATNWLTNPCQDFRGRTPLDLMRTPMGMVYIRTALLRRAGQA